jgi:hypothetical protein
MPKNNSYQILKEIEEEFDYQEMANACEDVSRVNLMGQGLDEGPQIQPHW